MNTTANVLVEGPAAVVDEVLLMLRPHLREPLVRDLAHAPLDLPDHATKPIILRNVSALTGDDQGRLMAWLQGAGLGAQVVSTTERPLFARVAQGLFDEALYYRLNVLLLRIGDTKPPRSARRRRPRPLHAEDVVVVARPPKAQLNSQA
jgi:hypothetical protein